MGKFLVEVVCYCPLAGSGYSENTGGKRYSYSQSPVGVDGRMGHKPDGPGTDPAGNGGYFKGMNTVDPTGQGTG